MSALRLDLGEAQGEPAFLSRSGVFVEDAFSDTLVQPLDERLVKLFGLICLVRFEGGEELLSQSFESRLEFQVPQAEFFVRPNSFYS